MKLKYFYIITIICFLTNMLTAQDGILDPTFGSDGIVKTNYGTGNGVAVQTDGKIVVAGNSGGVRIVRYNIDGSLDNSFGLNSLVFDLSAAGFDVAYSLTIQSDGKIIVAGFSNIGADYKNGFAMARLNVDGTLDNSFDTDGIVTTAFDLNGAGKGTAEGHSVTIQSDGKIIVAGYGWYFSEHYYILARYNVDGSLDTSFGFDGRVITDLGPVRDNGHSVAVQSDGKIVVAGETNNSPSADIALVRYKNDGSLDLAFGSSGIVITEMEGTDGSVNSLAIQPDGQIVVAANNNNGTDLEFAVVRYNYNGTLDTSFGEDGIATTNFGTDDDYTSALAVQSDGKIVVVGWIYNGVSHRDLALARYNINGSIDTSFGMGGKVTYQTEASTRGRSIAIQSDGKIVIAGDHGGFVLVARYNNPSLLVGIRTSEVIINGFLLQQNYPNPFNPATIISYSIPSLETQNFAFVQLKLYDVLGKEIATLVNEQQSPGNYKVDFDGSRLSSGIYYYQLKADKFIETKKMILMK